MRLRHWPLIVACALLAGCVGSKRETQSVERRVGTEQGQPTDLMITKQTRSNSEIFVPPATQSVLGGLAQLALGGTGLGGIAWGIAEFMRRRRAEKDADEVYQDARAANERAEAHALKRPPPEA